ncbi:Sn1-specific diacylglycerol lipase alpha [Phlyctema vagabunda]|uniref:sn-1-specific diacylglycerol lipase n=1 Tax=Phlyctema vagabunda TaxID=108571 RepID=A0ABR4PHP6_9HELO
MEQDDDFDFYPDDAVALRKDSQQGPGTTLLPAPIASVVSLVTRSSSLYIRVGTFVGGLFIDGARVTTLTGLELSRAVIEGILSRAGRDVTARSTGELGRAEAESLLEKSIATLHTTITSISFAASTGFYISSTALSTASDVSGQLLSTMDSILGSTDSSRAISSIITLIRREFRNPATGQEGEKVSVADLLLGICSLALLQRWSRKLTDIECKQRNYEHVIWDVVILDNGRRADVIGVDKNGSSTTREGDKHSSRFLTTRGEAEVLETVERDNINEDGSSEDDLPEINLKQRIMKSLPADASVSITTSTSTTTTVTVEITGSQPPDLIPPPGVEIIEENAHHPGPVDLDEMTTNEHNEQNVGFLTPRYRVVYRIMRDRVQGTDFETSEAIEAPEINEVIEVSDQEGPNEAEPKTTRPEMNFPTEAHLASPEAEDEPTSPPQTSSIPVTSPALRSRDMNSVSNSRTSPSSIRSESPSNKGYGTQMLPSTKGQAENLPYSKRARKPMSSSSSISSVDGSGKKAPAAFSRPSLKKIKSEPKLVNKSEKKGAFRNALRKGSTTPLSSLWNKDSSAPEAAISALPNKIIQRPTWGISAPSSVSPKSSVPSNLPIPKRGSTLVPGDTPRAPQRGNPNYFSSRDLGMMQPQELPRSPSRTSYYSIHEHRRNSLVSQTDTYSVHSVEARPCSPTAFRTHLKAQSTMLRARSEKGIAGSPSISPQKNQHRRNVSHAPSIYTLRTNNSATSLILAGQPGKSAFESQETMESLMRTGFVDGLFPQHHIVRNITRFVKFASASYGASFLRVMGITTSTGAQSREFNTEHHHEHHSFSNHTQLPADTILLSSFVDPQGGTDSSGHTNTGVPMVHFVSLDHESKAVVLTCRGTLGFDDVLADMTCDYDEVFWRGRAYKVHKGIYASARRLLSSRVFVTITAALEEFPEYGLVLCGHSLGGGVTALLAILISEPATTGTAFVTTSEYQRPQLMLPSATDSGTASPQIHIPAGRPIHVYAYGPPATFSPSLRLATRGLITTIVNGQDLVPHLSLGVLHDLQAVALALKTDPSGAKGEVRNRLFAGLTSAFADRWYGNRPAGMQGEAEDDKWAYSALKSLRASMLSSKLLPPGEVFVVEASPVLQRHAFVEKGEEGERKGLGRPATRSILKYVRDVEARFGEVRFGGSMLLDHSPGRYEVSLEALRRGVLG